MTTLKKFRTEFNLEVDHKIKHAQYELLKILQEKGILQNYNNLQPHFVDYNKKFDEIFKSVDEIQADENEEEEDEYEEENMDDCYDSSYSCHNVKN